MGKFKIIETKIKGVLIIEPTVYEDARGYFMECYNKRDFAEAGIDADFVQDNRSQSTRGVLRGMHFQVKHPQGKLVNVLKGEVYDVAVDIREGSPTYRQWVGVNLSDQNRRMLYMPPGMAHGFLVLSDIAEFGYKCTDFYHPEDEGHMKWNDPEVGIEWPVPDGMELIMSAKDS